MRIALLRCSRLMLTLAALAAVAGGARAALAQQNGPYATWEFDEKLRRDTDIAKILDGRMPLDENLEHFKNYFTNYYFAEMTQPENVNRLPELRETFYKRIWRAKDPKAYTALNEHTLTKMRELIRGNFHPAVRYNAVIMIGDLDVAPRTLVGRQVKPTPWPGAVSTLVACAIRPGFPDYIRAGALVGLLRHVELGLASEHRDGVVAAMRDIIKVKTPPDGRDREAHDWLRRRACEIVGAVGITGGDNSIPALLIDVMNDPQATLAFRATAAEALGKLRYDGTLGIDTKKLTAGMGDVTIAVCDHVQKQIPTAGDANAARLAASLLKRVQTGLAAPAKIAEGADKTLARDMGTQVTELLGKLENGSSPELKDDLNRIARDLSTKLGRSPAPTSEAVSVAAPEATASPAKSNAKEASPAKDILGTETPF